MDDQKEKEATLNRRPKDPAQAQKEGKAQAQAQQQKAQTPSEAAAAIQKMADDIEKAMQTLIEEKLINVRRSTFWLEVEINTSILYSSGSARLEAGAMPVLEELATILIPFPNVIHVEGFTDNVPISTLMYPSNWELSAARAASVVTLLEKAGVSPTRLAAIGHGEYQPVADNSTAEGRARNRRVVVVVMSNVEEHDAPDAAALDEIGKQSPESTATAPLAQPLTVPAPVKAAPAPREPGEPIDVTGEETVVSRFPIIRMPIALPFPARRAPVVITPPLPAMQPLAVPPTE